MIPISFGKNMKALATLLVLLGATLTLTAADAYFPKGSISEFEQEWYGKHLSAMIEPALSPTGKDSGYFAFRVLYLPTWGRPVAVRYEGKQGGFVRRSVMLSGEGGYDPGKIASEKEVKIAKQEVAALIASLEKAGFWKMPQQDDVIGRDGSEVIIEVIRAGEHRVRVRWTPEFETEKRGLSALVALYTAQFQSAGFWKTDEKNAEGGAANGSQPNRAETNRTSSVAGSRR